MSGILNMRRYYDRNGKQIFDLNLIGTLLNNNVILEYEKGKIKIITIHLVMDHSNSLNGSKRLFKTTFINNGQEEFIDYYETKEEAKKGHERFVNIVEGVEEIEEIEELDLYCECEISILFNFGCQCGGI